MSSFPHHKSNNCFFVFFWFGFFFPNTALRFSGRHVSYLTYFSRGGNEIGGLTSPLSPRPLTTSISPREGESQFVKCLGKMLTGESGIALPELLTGVLFHQEQGPFAQICGDPRARVYGLSVPLRLSLPQRFPLRKNACTTEKPFPPVVSSRDPRIA